ncbi:MAG: chorismate synthase [Lachnospiraceae bacterium]|nr:chorismate synthase [Lachnospiraceae bacterium]
MAGSNLGTILKISTWGESHGKAVGVVIDGCPAGLSLCEEDIQVFLDRRKPGTSPYSTPRSESDTVQILSGVFEGATTGTPISLLVQNEDYKSEDYDEISSCYRPGHADYTYEAKYGIRDPRGGGRSSGRETVGRVAAGAVASKLLAEMGVSILTYAKSIGPVSVSDDEIDPDEITKNPLGMPSASAAKKAMEYLDACREKQDSCGGVVECVVTGLPAGIGEPVFDKLDADLAKAILSIGAVKGFEIGDGFTAAKSTGSKNNDAFLPDGEGRLIKETNHAGGTLGGISDGSPVLFRAAIKPTPSIGITQQTVDKNGQPTDIEITGRHDPVIVPRAIVVVEAMTALTLADLLLLNTSSRMDYLKKVYE